MYLSACQYYSPAAPSDGEAGLVPSAEHPYDQLLPFEACWSPARGASRTSWQTCTATIHADCPYFVPETQQTLRFVRLDDPTAATVTFLLLGRIRTRRAVGEYRVFRWLRPADQAHDLTPDPATVATIFAIDTATDPAANVRARQWFAEHCARSGDSVTVVELVTTPPQSDTDESYFAFITQGS